MSVSLEARYELLEKIASGSFATVYRARDLELGREVAVKQIHEQYLEEPQQLERYWQEAQLLASLHHPNIVTIFDLVRERGWLVMELMQGNLAQMQRGRPMDLTSLKTTVAHSLRALKFLHEHGIVHGDIKPSNMLLDRRRRIKLGDFGLARRVSDEEGSLIKGTTKYMAPEVMSEEFGDVGPASDLYSLGFSAFDLMCGERFESLFPGLNLTGRDKQLAWMMWHAARDRRLPAISRVLEGVPEDLAKVIEKLTRKNQAERYRTADEALQDLKVDSKTSSSTQMNESADTPPPTTEADKKRKYLVIGAFAVSVLMCVAMLFLPTGPTVPPVAAKGRSGIIREVQADAGKLVLEDEEGVPSELEVGRQPKIFLTNDHKNILLRELQPDDRVRIENEPNGALKLRASRPVTTTGRLKRVDLQRQQVVLNIEEGAFRGELPIVVAQRTTMDLNGVTAKLNELEPEDRLEVRHLEDLQQEDRQMAVHIHALRVVRESGFVDRWLPQQQELTVQIRKGTSTYMVNYPVEKTAKITLADGRTVEGAAIQPDDLKHGDRIVLHRDTAISELVATRNELMSGSLISLDLPGKSLVLNLDSGRQQTFVVDDETVLEIGGTGAGLDELREFDDLKITYTSQGDVWTAASIDASRPVRHDRWVVLVAFSHYDDRQFPANAQAVADTRKLREVLAKRYAVASDQLMLLIDPSSELLERMVGTALQQAASDSQVIIYFNGWAYRNGAGHILLVPVGFDLMRTVGTSVALRWVVENFENCRSTDKMLILDGGIATGKTLPQGLLGPGEIFEELKKSEPPLDTTAVLTPLGPGETRAESAPNTTEPFINSLLTAFNGAADSNRNLRITPQELLDFLTPNLQEAGTSLKPQLQLPLSP